LRQGVVPYWGATGVLDHVDKWLFDEELVLLGEDGAPFFDGTKRVAFRVTGKIWVNNHAHVLRPNGRASASFLQYWLNQVDYADFVEGSTRDKLTQGKMRQIPVLLPPRGVQDRIVAFLDHKVAAIGQLIQKKERLIELLQEKRQALITQAVTRGLDPGVPMKESGLGWLDSVPEHWRRYRLRHLAASGLSNGLFKKKDEFGSGVLLVNVFDIYRNDFSVSTDGLERVQATSSEVSTFGVKPGDIFLVRSSLKREGVARAAIAAVVPEEMVFECHLVRLRPARDVVDPVFLVLLLNCVPVRDRLVAASNTTTMTTIAQDELAGMEVAMPPLEEQKRIVAHLSGEMERTEKVVARLTTQNALLHEYRQALISAAVTGQIDVTNETS
jgi:type I restriction enzyme, S subunit